MSHRHELPTYEEDPALYGNNLLAYLHLIEMLQLDRFVSPRKPSLSEYDRSPED